MKKFKYLPLALAALALGACSSDDIAVSEGGGAGVPAGEKGYVSLAINLPTQPSTLTRATTDNSATLDDGDACEYNVNDATLLLFVGDSEESSVFDGAYTLTGAGLPSDPADDHITSTYTYVSQITKPETEGTEKIYALVVLNKSGILTNEGSAWKVGNVSLTAGTKFSDINVAMTLTAQQQAAIANRSGSGNFLMTNAPLYNQPGGDKDPTTGDKDALQTLAVVNPDNIETSPEDAERNPAATVYVERAVAKVTVNATNVDTDDMPAGVTAQVVGWTLDVTNNKTFFVRDAFDAPWWGYNATTPNVYRFVGNTPVETGVSLYRTYWAFDPNYDGQGYTTGGNVTANNTDFTSLAGTAPTTYNTGFGEENPDYCLENTFNTANMRKDQTTRVIVAVKLGVTGADATTGDFFVLNGVRSTFYNKTGIDNYIKSLYIAAAEKYMAENDIEYAGEDNTKAQLGGEDIYVSFKKGDATASVEMGGLKGGSYILSEVYVKSTAADKFADGTVPEGLAANNEAITSSLNVVSIDYYQGGIAYYPVMIQHFDNTNETAAWSESTVENGNSYPGTDADQKWMGRYGVLRNNWYDINVTAIRNFGSPDVEPGTGYDDPPSSYIAVKINILSWAKRSQDAEL